MIWDLLTIIAIMWNMKVMVRPIVIGAFSAMTKGLVQGQEDMEIRGWMEDQPEYYEESWRIEETCCHSDSSGKPSANISVKNSHNNKLIKPKFLIITIINRNNLFWRERKKCSIVILCNSEFLL